MYKFKAYKVGDRILIPNHFENNNSFLTGHVNIILATPTKMTEYNYWPNSASLNDFYKSLEEIDLMDYPKLIPHMIKVVGDHCLDIYCKNKLAKLLLSKGLSEENVKYGIDYSPYKDVESVVKYLRVRGRLW